MPCRLQSCCFTVRLCIRNSRVNLVTHATQLTVTQLGRDAPAGFHGERQRGSERERPSAPSCSLAPSQSKQQAPSHSHSASSRAPSNTQRPSREVLTVAISRLHSSRHHHLDISLCRSHRLALRSQPHTSQSPRPRLVRSHCISRSTGAPHAHTRTLVQSDGTVHRRFSPPP